MSSKLLQFLGLAGSEEEVVVESHRRSRRNDYMKKFHRLVVPEDEEGVGAASDSSDDQPVRGYVAVKDDPLTDDVPATPAPTAPAPEPEKEPEDETPKATPIAEAVSARSARAENGGRGAHSAPEEKTFSSKLRNFGESLRRPKDGAQPLVLVKKGAREMLEDIEEALVDGQTVMLDFEKEDRKVASDVVTRIVNFVRVHNGAFYTITSTSLLLSLDKNAVIEWLPEGSDAPER